MLLSPRKGFLYNEREYRIVSIFLQSLMFVCVAILVAAAKLFGSTVDPQILGV